MPRSYHEMVEVTAKTSNVRREPVFFAVHWSINNTKKSLGHWSFEGQFPSCQSWVKDARKNLFNEKGKVKQHFLTTLSA